MIVKKINPGILYVFGGEKAQGAEIVIERLMTHNAGHNNIHLILSPGEFADGLIKSKKPYHVKTLSDLRKLNRSNTPKIIFLLKAIKNYFFVSFKVGQYIVRNNIKIVHANTIVPASYLLLLILYAKVFMPRVKWYWSDHDMRYFSGMETRLSKYCLSLYDRTLVVSAAVKKKYGLLQKTPDVLYNGLDTNVFKPDPIKRKLFRQQWNLKDDDFAIGIVAVINPDKGQLSLIEIFNEVAAIYPDCRLFLAGSYSNQFPQYCDDVKNAINASFKVNHIGFTNDITDFYNGCDIIVSNSNAARSESLGTSIYEAMSCEKLVVAADTGGTPEIITDKLDGFLFKTDDLNELKSRLLYVIAHNNELVQVKIAARKKAIQKFGIQNMVNNYNRLLSKDIV